MRVSRRAVIDHRVHEIGIREYCQRKVGIGAAVPSTDADGSLDNAGDAEHVKTPSTPAVPLNWFRHRNMRRHHLHRRWRWLPLRRAVP